MDPECFIVSLGSNFDYFSPFSVIKVFNNAERGLIASWAGIIKVRKGMDTIK